MICHVCGMDCGEEEFCPACGAQLSGTGTGEESGIVVLQNPTLAASVEDVVTAEIFGDVLRENGIPFTCDGGEDEGAMRVTFGGGFVAQEFYVEECHLEAAQKIYEEVLASEPEMDWDFEESEEESAGDFDAE